MSIFVNYVAGDIRFFKIVLRGYRGHSGGRSPHFGAHTLDQGVLGDEYLHCHTDAAGDKPAGRVAEHEVDVSHPEDCARRGSHCPCGDFSSRNPSLPDKIGQPLRTHRQMEEPGKPSSGNIRDSEH